MFANGTITGCPTLLTFRCRLAWHMINNTWIQLEEQQAHEVSIASVHQLMTTHPPCKSFQKSSVDLYCSVEAPAVHVQASVWKQDQNLLRMSTRELALLQLLPRARPKVGNDGLIESGHFSTFFWPHFVFDPVIGPIYGNFLLRQTIYHWKAIFKIQLIPSKLCYSTFFYVH